MKKRRLILIIGIILIFISCNQNNIINDSQIDSTIWDSIKTSNNHQDYMNFMINHTESQYFDTALTRYFKYKHILYDSIGPPMWDCFNRCISIVSNDFDTILFENEPIFIEELDRYALKYLINKENDELLPEQILISDINGDERMISSGFFFLQIDLESHKNLKQIINEVKIAYKNYKDFLSKQWYNVNFDRLNSNEKDFINKVVKTRIVIEKHYEVVPIIEELIEEDKIINEL